MPIHHVRPGECLTSLAARYRLSDYRALHDHPQNAELKKLRKNPNILLPGDQVFVPDEPEPKMVEIATGKLHQFKVKQKQAKLRVYLQNEDLEPYAQKRFEIRLGAVTLPGETTKEGLVEVDVPADQDRCTLAAWLFEPEDPDDPDEPPDVEYELWIGHLDPVTSITGLQARLDNLGFRCPVSGALGEETLAAIERFRARHAVKPEGDAPIDEPLLSKLAQMHEGG